MTQKPVIAAMAAMALCWTTGAAAAVLTTHGTLTDDGGGMAVVAAIGPAGYGRNREVAVFSAPGAGIELSEALQIVFNDYCDFHDGNGFVNCGGDEDPYYPDEIAGPGATRVMLSFPFDPPYHIVYNPDLYENGFSQYLGGTLTYYFGDTKTVDYTLTTYSPVPEPATWGLTITGLGLAGAMLRRRHTAPVQA